MIFKATVLSTVVRKPGSFSLMLTKCGFEIRKQVMIHVLYSDGPVSRFSGMLSGMLSGMQGIATEKTGRIV